MDSVAEAGVAAHWSYKLGETVASTRASRWMRDVLEMQKNAGDSMEFIENLKIDLFPDEVYVFTRYTPISATPVLPFESTGNWRPCAACSITARPWR